MKQSTTTILMVRPAAFGFDPLSAASNVFQEPAAHNPQPLALAEFDTAVDQLQRAGVNLVVIQDTPQPPKPDAIFPNNWFSTWPDGRVFLYPMCVPTRRLERRADVLQRLRHLYRIGEVVDLSAAETAGSYLESTGAMVFDHLNKTVYACISARCDEELLRQHASQLGYAPVLLHATDSSGTAIYHTNVMMAIQTNSAVVCTEFLPVNEQALVFRQLQATGRDITVITPEQVRAFAGNMLEVTSQAGERLLVLSQNAYDCLSDTQRRRLGADKTLLPIAIPTIEMVGGGSIRCMMAEIFLQEL